MRPISSIRYMGGLGQSSDPNGDSYDPLGLPLVPGLIEVVTDATTANGTATIDITELSGTEGRCPVPQSTPCQVVLDLWAEPQ